MSKHSVWTRSMDKRLIALNRDPFMTRAQMAAVLNVSFSAVCTRLRKLAANGRIPPDEAVRKRGRKKGVTRNRPKWTDERLDKLIALFDGERSDAHIGELMGETATAIRGQVYLLRKAGRLPKTRRARTGHEGLPMSRLFSVQQDHELIRRWKRGQSIKRIAAELGFTQRQIQGRVDRLQKAEWLPKRGHAWSTQRRIARQRRIAKMYRAGTPIKQIARAMRTTQRSIIVELVRMRKLGMVGYRQRPYGRSVS